MSVMTKRQREVLEYRLARAICWAQVPVMYRDEGKRLAQIVVAEMDETAFSAGTARRAVMAVVERIEEEAS